MKEVRILLSDIMSTLKRAGIFSRLVQMFVLSLVREFSLGLRILPPRESLFPHRLLLTNPEITVAHISLMAVGKLER